MKERGMLLAIAVKVKKKFSMLNRSAIFLKTNQTGVKNLRSGQHK